MVDHDRIQAAIKAAISTRGPNAGRLKRKQPPHGSDALAAWAALMVRANPYKVSPFTIMLFTDEQHTI